MDATPPALIPRRSRAVPEDAAPAAISLYRGRVMHARLRPVGHRFSYRVFSILVDLDRLDEAHRACALFSVNRANLLSFHERDHGPCDGTPLRAYATDLLKGHGIDVAGGRILLLAYPRCLGFVFNPLSVYYAYGADGTLKGVLYEVRNTFGERHTYVAPVETPPFAATGIRQTVPKAFHVSPFLGMAARYDFRLRLPGERLTVRILEADWDGPVLAAGFTAERERLTARSALAASLRVPAMTLKVGVAIHWEALRLWLKGVRVVPRPAPRARAAERPGESNSQAA